MLNLKSLLFKERDTSTSRHHNDTSFLSAIAECADGLWDWNPAQKELYISQKLRELIGYSEEETRGHPLSWWVEKIHPDDQIHVHGKLEEIRSTRCEFVYFDAFRFICKNGDYLWLENHAKILRNTDGKLIRISGMTNNVTPQKYIQNQFYTIIAKQEQEAQNKTRFLSTLSHELRSPLSGIIGMTSLLKETILSEEQNHFIENISNSTEMLLTLVNDILDFTKLNSGKFEFEKIKFSPALVLKRATDLTHSTVIKKNLTFNTSIDSDIPEFLLGDPTRLQQILVNLLSNSAKFTSSGGITLIAKRIQLSPASATTPTIHTLHFEIHDTGIGISPEIHKNLFKDFAQANSSITRMYGGTGLGLSICKELVHLMGGQIGVQSEPNKGSMFWFDIPFEEPENLNTTKNFQSFSNSELSNQNKLNVLLVEDNQVNQEVMRGLLTVLGDEITVANNGKEAIDLFQTQKFDIILMDLNMPILDGLSATQAIRKLPNGNIPIIAITANTFTGELENCLQYGITQVLNKPINKITLEMALYPHRSLANEHLTQKHMGTPNPSLSRLVDHETVKTLIKDLGKDKVIKLLDIYRNDASTLVKQIRSHPNQESSTYAHTLAGMSENLGILLVGKTARDIMNAIQNAPENLLYLIEDLEKNFEKSSTEIGDIVQSINLNS